MSSPTLPVELERKIFELAFDPCDRTGTNGNMLLVARRVRIWIRPFIYRVFGLHDARQFPIFSRCPEGVDQDEIASMAEHLIVDVTESTDAVNALISKCPNIWDLACLGTYDLFDILESVSKLKKLRRFSGDLRRINEEQLSTSPFAFLTHLELLFPRNDWPFEALHSLKHLTHLLIFGDGHLLVNRIPKLFSSCDFLVVLAVCTGFSFSHDRIVDDEIVKILDAETRLVFFYYSMSTAEDWILAAYGGKDVWWHAENFVFARQHHYFVSNDYQKFPIDETFDWLEHLMAEGKRWYLSL
ncbi:hypothetical protein BJ165DRAFT_195213 [Panaeolus papilionaceus]|nr:hypothetical protein BJ165DRAFT_195213 [Panaeolus papilionaceus]